MPQFSVQGTEKYDFYLVDGSIDWAILPAGTISSLCYDTPIRVQVGVPPRNHGWGYTHTTNKHGHWLTRNNSTLEELLYKKLGQCGTIYTTEECNKIKIAMRLSPSSLLLLRYIEKGRFLTLVTMYNLNHKIDGNEMGRYNSSFRIKA